MVHFRPLQVVHFHPPYYAHFNPLWVVYYARFLHFDLVQDDLREILNSPYIKPHEVNRISDSFNEIVENSLEGLEFIDKILSSNNLKMTDAERAEVLKAKERESKEMVAEIEAKTKRYREIIVFREIQDKINNRETNY